MLPLQGIRILDFSIGQAGPYGTAMLADMGAEVIKVEEPREGDFGRYLLKGHRVDPFFLVHNRGKKAIAVDLRHPKGKEAILRLVETADAVVESSRQGALERLGLGYANLCKINPRIIYVSASGYGRKGPWSMRPLLDLAAQGAGGIMSINGEPDQPPAKVGAPVADGVGGIMVAYALALSLLTRELTGIGQEVDVSLFGSQISLQSFYITTALVSGVNQPRQGRAQARALWTNYRCADDRWIVVAILPLERYWPPVCRALGREDLTGDPRFCNNEKRNENRAGLMAILGETIASRPSQYWLDAFAEQNAVCAPVNSYTDLGDDPQALANGYIVEYNHPEITEPVKMVGLPVNMSKTPGSPYNRAPHLGEHNEEVLRSVGYSEEEIASMRAEGVIGG